jgi:hypothetical protein
MEQKSKRIFTLFLLLGIFGVVSGALALELNWPNSPTGTQLNDNTTLSGMVQYFYEWGIAIGGLAAFIALIAAGFQYLTSAGDPTKMADARSKITSAIFGLALLLSSWLILNTINPELTSFLPVDFDLSDVAEDIDTDIGDFRMLPCASAKLYNDTNFGTFRADIYPEDTWRAGLGGATVKSVKAFKVDGTECSEGACGCLVRLYAGDWLGDLFTVCGNAIGDVPAYSTNLYTWVDAEIRCVQLIQPGAF